MPVNRGPVPVRFDAAWQSTIASWLRSRGRAKVCQPLRGQACCAGQPPNVTRVTTSALRPTSPPICDACCEGNARNVIFVRVRRARTGLTYFRAHEASVPNQAPQPGTRALREAVAAAFLCRAARESVSQLAYRSCARAGEVHDAARDGAVADRVDGGRSVSRSCARPCSRRTRWCIVDLLRFGVLLPTCTAMLLVTYTKLYARWPTVAAPVVALLQSLCIVACDLLMHRQGYSLSSVLPMLVLSRLYAVRHDAGPGDHHRDRDCRCLRPDWLGRWTQHWPALVRSGA